MSWANLNRASGTGKRRSGAFRRFASSIIRACITRQAGRDRLPFRAEAGTPKGVWRSHRQPASAPFQSLTPPGCLVTGGLCLGLRVAGLQTGGGAGIADVQRVVRLLRRSEGPIVLLGTMPVEVGRHRVWQ